MNEDEKKRSMFLYELLASLLRGRLLTVLRGIPENNGYEALRQLVMQCQPTSRNRSLGILNALMSWKEIQTVRGLARTIIRAVREGAQAEVDVYGPLAQWAFRHAAWLLSHFRRPAGSPTAYEMITGRR